MTKPIIRIVDSETNEVIDREMNDVEFAQYKADKAAFESQQVQAEEKIQAKSALLEKLGITEDEAKLLLA